MTCVFVCPEDVCKQKLARALVHCTAHYTPGKLTEAHVRQWRIQDFPEVGAPTLGGACQHTILPNLTKYCMKIERIWTPREGGVPLRSANVELSTKQISVKVTPTTEGGGVVFNMLESYPKKCPTPKLLYVL